MTAVNNPTKWNDDAHGNDMPATYLYDAYKRAELMMFFDFTAMGWMSLENVARFFNYRCGYKRRYQPKPAAALGLHADGFSGRTFPAGKQRFVYYVTAAPRADTPTDAQAVQTLVERCLPLLPAHGEWPERATDWRDFARRCAADLMTDGHAWRRDQDGNEFLLNYVDAHSPAWKEAIEARGRAFDMNQPCLESAVWSAHPLSVMARVEPGEELWSRLNERMLAFIDRMVAAGKTPLAPAKDDAPRGSWQHFYSIEQMFQVARLRGDEALMRALKRETDEVIVPLTRKMQYLLPLCFGKRSLVQVGAGDTHSLLGTYASLMLDLHEWTGDATYLEEAKRALRVNAKLPINSVHQVFLLGMGVHASARFAASQPRDRDEFLSISRYLLAQTLRMLHWFNDRTAPETRAINTLGMFQACATISYPALFENVETLARIAPALKLLGASEALLRVFDHARRNNFYFFPQCLPDGFYDGPLKYVPLENIGILEGPPPTTVGAEIYGAGWTFRAYLLWEAFGRARDRDIMVLNLDQFDERRQLEQGRWDLRFVAFNPTLRTIETELIFPLALERAATLDAKPLAGGRAPICLDPGEASWFNLTIP
jgi:hypothetical protein